MVLEVAKIIREDYLQQDAFSNYDYNCPLYKSSGMMRCIICYYEDARKTILESSGEKKNHLGFDLHSFQGPVR